MKRSVISLVLLAGIFISAVSAGGITEVQLIDGSVIRGDIISSHGGVYTLKSKTCGTIKIEESKIRAIRFKNSLGVNAKERATTTDSPGAQVQLLQQLLMGDQEILPMILSLLNDPDIQGILEDPSIIEAVNGGI